MVILLSVYTCRPTHDFLNFHFSLKFADQSIRQILGKTKFPYELA